MLQRQIRNLGKFLPQPVFFYSTSVVLDKKIKSILIEKLSDEFSDVKSVIRRLRKCDEINTNFDEWKSRIYAMKSYGFSDSNCFEMILKCPLVLEIPLCKFQDTMQQWYHADLGVQNVESLLLNQPTFFKTDAADIRRRIPKLMFIFGSSNLLTQFLKNSPNVMFDDWNSVLEKVNYLMNVRRYKPGDIAQFPFLVNSLDFMKFRFDLLEKCGVYKQNTLPIHKVNKYDVSEHVNPVLHKILMTDVADFVKVAQISEEEYLVYKDLFMMNDAYGDGHVDDDDDEDEDHGGSYKR